VTTTTTTAKFTIKPLKWNKDRSSTNIEGYAVMAVSDGTFETFNSTRSFKTREKAMAAVEASYYRDTKKRLQVA